MFWLRIKVGEYNCSHFLSNGYVQLILANGIIILAITCTYVADES